MRQDSLVVTVRYFAAARAAAGVSEEITEAHTLEELLRSLADTRGERLAAVLGSASFLVDGLAWRDRDARLPAGATVDVLPPVAGG
jgi:molybdopterin synthase sulfur carrier subunit